MPSPHIDYHWTDLSRAYLQSQFYTAIGDWPNKGRNRKSKRFYYPLCCLLSGQEGLHLATSRGLIIMCHLHSGSLETAFDVEAFVGLRAVQDALYPQPISRVSKETHSLSISMIHLGPTEPSKHAPYNTQPFRRHNRELVSCVAPISYPADLSPRRCLRYDQPNLAHVYCSIGHDRSAIFSYLNVHHPCRWIAEQAVEASHTHNLRSTSNVPVPTTFCPSQMTKMKYSPGPCPSAFRFLIHSYRSFQRSSVTSPTVVRTRRTSKTPA